MLPTTLETFKTMCDERYTGVFCRVALADPDSHYLWELDPDTH
jgi:hypothetical protein